MAASGRVVYICSRHQKNADVNKNIFISFEGILFGIYD